MGRCLGLLAKNNITFTKQPDEGISYRWQGVDIEHHSRLFDLYNPFLQGFVGKLEGQKDTGILHCQHIRRS